MVIINTDGVPLRTVCRQVGDDGVEPPTSTMST